MISFAGKLDFSTLEAMASHVVKYTRMDSKREIKLTLESFWHGKSSAADLDGVAKALKLMVSAGVKLISSHAFS